MTKPDSTRSALPALLAVALGCALALVVGCAPAATPAKPPADPSNAVVPASWDLRTPPSAVSSYLDWMSFAYRMANSEIASQAMTATEGVRVDAYIQLNKQQNRAIDQRLTAFEVRSLTERPGTATLAASEKWEYRYFDLTTLEWTSDELTASYDTTYSLVREARGWLVDSVEATSSVPVK